MTQGGQKYYLYYDQVGSLRAVSDASHNIVKEIIYDTYGNILSDSNRSLKVPFGFAGGLYDPDTNLTHFGFREYDAYTGKWTAKDPILFEGGDSNLYGYVLGDPVNLVDPEGNLPSLDDLNNAYYEHMLGKLCREMLINYDCGCMTGIECALAREQLRENCKALFRKDIANKNVPDRWK